MKKLVFRALDLRQGESYANSIRSEKKLALQTSAFESLYGGHFTLSTQLGEGDWSRAMRCSDQLLQ